MGWDVIFVYWSNVIKCDKTEHKSFPESLMYFSSSSSSSVVPNTLKYVNLSMDRTVVKFQ